MCCSVDLAILSYSGEYKQPVAACHVRVCLLHVRTSPVDNVCGRCFGNMSVVVNPRADTRVEKPDPRVCAGAPCGWRAARSWRLEASGQSPRRIEDRKGRWPGPSPTHWRDQSRFPGILRITASAIDDDSEATRAPQYILILQSRVVALRFHSDPSICSKFWAANYHKQQYIQ